MLTTNHEAFRKCYSLHPEELASICFNGMDSYDGHLAHVPRVGYHWPTAHLHKVPNPVHYNCVTWNEMESIEMVSYVY